MKKKIVFIFILLLILILILILYYKENNEFSSIDQIENISFLKKEETRDKVKNNDDFRKTLYKKHYLIRGSQDWEGYMDIIKQSFADFTPSEKDKLVKCARRADRKLLLIQLKGFDGLKASKLPWYFGLTKDYLYEEGLPHTVGNTIILTKNTIDKSSIDFLVGTLIHEKIHIYQKIYPEDIVIYLSENGFEKIRSIKKEDDVRVNPDICIDNSIYFNKRENRYYGGIKNKSKIHSPENTMEKILTEHPYESMAILIERMGASKHISEYDF